MKLSTWLEEPTHHDHLAEQAADINAKGHVRYDLRRGCERHVRGTLWDNHTFLITSLRLAGSLWILGLRSSACDEGGSVTPTQRRGLRLTRSSLTSPRL